MYSFLYYYLYKLAVKRNPDAKFAAASVLCATQAGHFLLIGSLLKLVVTIGTFQFSDIYVYNKLAWMPFVLIWLILTHIYFKRRFDLIEKKYAEQNILNWKNTIIVCSLIFPPFIIGITIMNII